MNIYTFLYENFEVTDYNKAIFSYKEDGKENYYTTTNKKNIMDFYEKICLENCEGIEHVSCYALDRKYPIIINITNNFDGMTKEKAYDQSLYYSLIYSSQQTIVKLYNLNISNDEAVCFLYDRSEMVGKSLSFNLLLYFPYISLPNKDSIKEFKNELITNLKSKDFEQVYFNHANIKNLNSILNLRYSSCSPIFPRMSEYFVGSYNWILEDEINEGDDLKNPLVETFIFNGLDQLYNEVNNHNPKLITLYEIINNGYDSDKHKNFNFEEWIPMFISFFNTPFDNTSEKQNRVKNIKYDEYIPFGSRFIENININRESLEDEFKEIIHKLIPLILDKRYTEFFTCELIGQALYNTYNSSTTGLNYWIKYCKEAYERLGKYPIFIEERLEDDKVDSFCSSLYENYSNSNITVRSIAWYAKMDNHELYLEWWTEWVRDTMEFSVKQTDVKNQSNICQVFYRYCWLDICYSHKTGETNGTWYVFAGNTWKDALHKVLVFDKLRSLSSLYYKAKIEVIKSQMESVEEKEIEKYKHISKKIDTIITAISNVTFINGLIELSKSLFLIDDLDKKLNASNNLMGVKNGVLEMSGNRVIFRSGIPEDYISFSTTTPYRKLSYDDETVIELLEWIRQMHPNKDTRKFFLRYLSSYLHGDNMGNYFTIWTGSTSNSKSTFTKLIRTTLGNYFLTLPTTVITSSRKNGLGKAIPELATSAGKKAGFVEEARKTDNLNEQVIKSISGLDSMFVRNLYSKGGTIDISFKLVIICNDPPRPETIDKAFIRRVLVIPFIASYSEDAPKSLEEQRRKHIYPMKSDINKKLKKMSVALLWLMVEYYADFAREGLKPSKEIKDATAEYINEQDKYEMFINSETEYITKDGLADQNIFISTAALYEEFKSWIGNLFESYRKPEFTEFVKNMNSKWGEAKNGVWYGHKLNEENNDDSAFMFQ